MLLAYACFEAAKYHHFNFSEEVAGTIFLGSILAIPASILLHKFASFFTDKYANIDKLTKIFTWFIQNYNPDINAKMDINFKKFTPQEYHESLDKMQAEYVKSGEKYLKKEDLFLATEIISKLIHEIKREKYKEPEIVVVNNPTPVFFNNNYGYNNKY